MLEQTEGTVQKIAGRVQDAFGAATGDAETQAKGKAREAVGSVQESYGEVLNQVRESAVSNPVVTLAVIAGIGFVLGAAWAKR